MSDPTSSYATAGIAHRVSGTLKAHHNDKVETPSVEYVDNKAVYSRIYLNATKNCEVL
jgi:hypothetical protein